MTSDVKIPEWAEKAAFEAQTAAIRECQGSKLFVVAEYPFVTGSAKEVLDRHIAHALLAAEQRGLEKAAEVADAYAEVNWEQCTDSILLDPVLSNRGERALTKDDWARAERMSIDGTIHSSMYHAATNIAAAIRSLGEKP